MKHIPALPNYKDLVKATPASLYAEGAEEDLTLFEVGIGAYRKGFDCALVKDGAVEMLTEREKELVAAGAIAAISVLSAMLSADAMSLLTLPSNPALVIAAHATMAAHAVQGLGKTDATVN